MSIATQADWTQWCKANPPLYHHSVRYPFEKRSQHTNFLISQALFRRVFSLSTMVVLVFFFLIQNCCYARWTKKRCQFVKIVDWGRKDDPLIPPRESENQLQKFQGWNIRAMLFSFFFLPFFLSVFLSLFSVPGFERTDFGVYIRFRVWLCNSNFTPSSYLL